MKLELIIIFLIILYGKGELVNISKILSHFYHPRKLNNTKKNLKQAIYSITSKKFGQYNNLLYKTKPELTIYFSNSYRGSMKNIRFIQIKEEESIYYIEFALTRKIIGLNDSDYDLITLYNNISIIENNEILKWRVYKINHREYLIQNLFSKKFWKTKGFIYLDCTGELNDFNFSNYINSSLIENSLKFKITKLFEELKIRSEHIPKIEKETIDILIKYIDLNDPFLKRDGIKHIKKDKDNGELKYCLRSILKFIPWVRKIFILMPNEKISFLKPINEINDKIVYIKDKDLLGFDSESSTAFQYALFKLKNFGISDNFLLMDDDYFIGKELKKWDFFYFDENSQKVLPIITSLYFNYYEVQKFELISNIYFSLNLNYNDLTLPHTPSGWKSSKSRSLLFLMDQLGRPLINGGFDHNTIAVNINDIEEIYNLIYLKYKYSFITLNSIIRTKYDLQFQTLYLTYSLNKYNRKVRPINSKYYDLRNAKNITLGFGLFCINTGFIDYKESDFNNLKEKLEELFPEPTIFENILTDKSSNNNFAKKIDSI